MCNQFLDSEVTNAPPCAILIGRRTVPVRPLMPPSRNLWWMALLFWGEGWHNNHHARPREWNFRMKWWEFDIGAQVIRAILALERMRQGLRQVDPCSRQRV